MSLRQRVLQPLLNEDITFPTAIQEWFLIIGAMFGGHESGTPARHGFCLAGIMVYTDNQVRISDLRLFGYLEIIGEQYTRGIFAAFENGKVQVL